MTYWAYVKTDEDIEEYSELPTSWNNISNFHALESDHQYLKQLAWYELIDDTAPITNDFAQYHGAPEYVVDHEAGTVRKNCPIIQRESVCQPPSGGHQPHEPFEDFMTLLRRERNVRLRDSDWTQTVDLQAIKSEEWKTAWASYRQQLRDLPETQGYLSDINQVIWPPLPEIN